MSCIPALHSGRSRGQKSEQRPNIPIEVSRIPKSPQANIEILPEIRLRSLLPYPFNALFTNHLVFRHYGILVTEHPAKQSIKNRHIFVSITFRPIAAPTTVLTIKYDRNKLQLSAMWSLQQNPLTVQRSSIHKNVIICPFNDI